MDARLRAGALAAAGAAAALALAGTAAADKPRVSLTRAGNAAARAVVVQRADLGSAAAWTGGAKKPDLSSKFPCSGYQPKQSDLVVMGAARSTWQATGIEIDSESEVLQTPAMVGLDWQRSVLAPQVVPCLRSGLATRLGASGRLVSFGRVGFPSVASDARKYRALVDVTSGSATVRVMIDVVLLGSGRTEITLMTTAPLAADSSVGPAELRLARLLVSRVRA